MKLNHDIMAADTAAILEETSANITSRLIREKLNKDGVVTLEEASFYSNIVDEVITEATSEFVPDSIYLEEGFLSDGAAVAGKVDAAGKSASNAISKASDKVANKVDKATAEKRHNVAATVHDANSKVASTASEKLNNVANSQADKAKKQKTAASGAATRNAFK